MNGAVRIQQWRISLDCFRKFSSLASSTEEINQSHKVKIKKILELDQRVETDIESGSYHPRHHPGVTKKKADELPDAFKNAMEVLSEKRNKLDLVTKANLLSKRLWGRHLPPEEKDYREKIRLERMRLKEALNDLEDEIKEAAEILAEEKIVTKRVKETLHPWHPLNLTEETCLHYLLARTPAEYCILHSIFTGIRSVDPDFIPYSLFDFGSGVGSGYWAVKEIWQDSLKEVFNVDSNLEMNEMAKKILTIANTRSSAESGIFFRQFFPLSLERTYDITLSAFSLLELPSFKERMEAISLLWSKTEKYLVVVEDGTNAGYQAIIEARNLITHLETADDQIEEGVHFHVVAPCSHEFLCPRFSQNNTPCNFEISYSRPKFLQDKQIRDKHLYSYMVFKKGPRPHDHAQWPRCIRPTTKNKKQLLLHLCTPDGKLDNVLLQKDHNNRNSYRCAKYTKWGDLLPGKIREIQKKIPTRGEKEADQNLKNPLVSGGN